jgi:predicted RNase H-like HicB family nuclease
VTEGNGREKKSLSQGWDKMIRNYTAKYIKISKGYMGQLIEWPEVITEGRDIEECRRMLRDALKQMILANQQLNNEIPVGDGLIEQLPVNIQNVYQTA